MGRGKAHVFRSIRGPARIYSGKVKAAQCPTCKSILDGATGVAFWGEESRPPQPGDISICGYCSTVSTFTDEGLRLAEQHEIDRASHKFLLNVPSIRPSPFRSRGSH